MQDKKIMNRLKEKRQDFPMLKKNIRGKPFIYLDSAATSLKPQTVIDAISDFYQNHYGTVHRSVYQTAVHATEKHHEVRKKISRFLGAEREEEIIFTKGSTDGINLVASSFGKAFISEGDEVLISGMEHHSNIVPWQMICQERKAALKVFPINSLGEVELDEYEKMLSHKTKIVAFSHVSNVLGTVNPVKEMTKIAHNMGAKVLVDGAQAVAHTPVDVQDLNVDFYVFSSHKAYGPTGIGVLYGKYDLMERMPPYQGGGDMIENVSFEKTTYAPLPIKFEAGTPMIAQTIGLGAAIDYLSHIDFQHIHLHEQNLLHKGTKLLKEIDGLTILGDSPLKSSILTFSIDGIHPLDIGTALDLKGIAVRTGHHCAQPLLAYFNLPAATRISLALYNTEEEIEFFYESLGKTLNILR